MATLIIPSSVSVSHTLASYPAIALDSVSSSTNWTFTVAVISGGASSLSLDSSYLAAWTAAGELKIFPKVLGTFNATGNLYYRGARYFDHDGDSFLSVGDSFIFDKTTYASGMAIGLLLADSGWVYMAFYSIGEVIGKHPENYESLPPPPQPLNPMPIILIMVGIACLGIVFVLAKGIMKKRSH